ncbi:integrase core domain-containing protein [Streptomyces sp. 8N616]|uniref:integrase core domain-containing protein n=1 Tax=Streptomyces sp. 8N616 TaxID=3457414 RepID=UPI003FD4A1EE
MLAVDFFHVDCAATLRRLYVFFAMEVGGRYVHIPGTTSRPDGPWTTQQVRKLLVELGNQASEFTFLVRDRAGRFTAFFDAVLAGVDITVVKIPPRCPQANAYAERFVRTVRSEATDRMLIFGQQHLPAVLDAYAHHYNGRQPHRGQQPRPPRPDHPIADSQQRSHANRFSAAYQRVRASGVETRVSAGGPVLEPHKQIARCHPVPFGSPSPPVKLRICTR